MEMINSENPRTVIIVMKMDISQKTVIRPKIIEITGITRIIIQGIIIIEENLIITITVEIIIEEIKITLAIIHLISINKHNKRNQVKAFGEIAIFLINRMKKSRMT